MIVETLFKVDAIAVDSKSPPLGLAGTIEKDCDEWNVTIPDALKLSVLFVVLDESVILTDVPAVACA